MDGRCLFFLLQIPMAILDISSAQHPVKAGLSDAFMILNSSPEVPGESPGACVCPSTICAWFSLLWQRGHFCLAVSRERHWLVAKKGVRRPCTHSKDSHDKMHAITRQSVSLPEFKQNGLQPRGLAGDQGVSEMSTPYPQPCCELSPLADLVAFSLSSSASWGRGSEGIFLEC